MPYNLDFTIYSEDKFYDVVDMEKFRDEDAASIYEHLNKNMKLIPFGDYLKRYIFKKAGFDGNFDEIDIKDYQYIIMDSFSENCTPKSFSETASKMSVLAKNWLTQSSVGRNVVFLLGFGLGMSAEDVSEFLVNAQGEHDFNFKNPFEIICWFCFKNGLKYPDYVRLYEAYEKLPVNKEAAVYDSTIGVKTRFIGIRSEDELMAKLAEIKTENAGNLFSVSARKNFDELYDKVRAVIAEKYNEDEQISANEKAAEYLENLSNSDRLSFEEKNIRAQKIRESAVKYTIDNITEADAEKFLCCGVPFDGKGNLLKFSNSTLSKHFKNKRMSRKHLHDVLSGKSDIDRFDLITMSFFIHGMNENIDNSKVRYISFVDKTNEILRDSNMGDLYVANPYECFLMMCILSDWPMGAYSDVLELSFGEE